jgi:16S rRNA (cytosine967-C5)-methyltransferase
LERALALAIEALSWIELRGMRGAAALASASRQLRASRRDRAAARILVRETTLRRNLIDAVVARALAHGDADEYSLGVQSFLRLFAYQTRFCDADPGRLAKLGRRILGWQEVAPVEKALARLLTVTPGEIVATSADDATRIAFRTGHPRWFVRRSVRLVGRKPALSLLKGNNAMPPTFIRVNPLKGEGEELQTTLTGSGIRIDRVEGFPGLFRVGNHRQGQLAALDAYEAGRFSRARKITAIVARAAAPQPGSSVLEVSTGARPLAPELAQRMGNDGTIVTLCPSTRHVEEVRREAQRLGVTIVQPQTTPSGGSLHAQGDADLVLVHPRSSETGAFWRAPSIRWRVDENTIQRAAADAEPLLHRCVAHVGPDGRLVYWTRSVTLEENERVIERFLQRHPAFTLRRMEPVVGLPGFRGQAASQRFYPHTHETDGAFIATLNRP